MPQTIPQTNVQRVLSEDACTLQDAAVDVLEIIGRKPDKTTLYRWCLRGVGGIKLEHVRLGGRIITSRQAITRFIEARTAKGARSTGAAEGKNQSGNANRNNRHRC